MKQDFGGNDVLKSRFLMLYPQWAFFRYLLGDFFIRSQLIQRRFHLRAGHIGQDFYFFRGPGWVVLKNTFPGKVHCIFSGIWGHF